MSRSDLINLTGMVFGRLEVIGYHGLKNGKSYWDCLCACGKDRVIRGDTLKSGNTSSCGCYKDESVILVHTTHGKSKNPLYRRWSHIIQRCQNQNNDRYKDYGGRGITVCADWLKFESFYNWAIENGYSEKLTIDRIDVNGNYCPENCRWATQKEQATNRRNNRYLTVNGSTKLISEWAREMNMPANSISTRIKRGWSVEKAILTPPLIKR